MADKVTTYSSDALAYLDRHKTAILDYAQRLGTSAAAVAATPLDRPRAAGATKGDRACRS